MRGPGPDKLLDGVNDRLQFKDGHAPQTIPLITLFAKAVGSMAATFRAATLATERLGRVLTTAKRKRLHHQRRQARKARRGWASSRNALGIAPTGHASTSIQPKESCDGNRSSRTPRARAVAAGSERDPAFHERIASAVRSEAHRVLQSGRWGRSGATWRRSQPGRSPSPGFASSLRGML